MAPIQGGFGSAVLTQVARRLRLGRHRATFSKAISLVKRYHPNFAGTCDSIQADRYQIASLARDRTTTCRPPPLPLALPRNHPGCPLSAARTTAPHLLPPEDSGKIAARRRANRLKLSAFLRLRALICCAARFVRGSAALAGSPRTAQAAVNAWKRLLLGDRGALLRSASDAGPGQSWSPAAKLRSVRRASCNKVGAAVMLVPLLRRSCACVERPSIDFARYRCRRGRRRPRPAPDP